MNFYAVLGVSRDADDETIRSAYRILASRGRSIFLIQTGASAGPESAGRLAVEGAGEGGATLLGRLFARLLPLNY